MVAHHLVLSTEHNLIGCAAVMGSDTDGPLTSVTGNKQYSDLVWLF